MSLARNLERTYTRRTLYREVKRRLVRLMRPCQRGARRALRLATGRFLHRRTGAFLLRVLRDHAFACAVATAVLAGTPAAAAPPVELSDVSAGVGGFMMRPGIEGIHESGFGRSGLSVSGAGDVNGDGLADLIVGAPFAFPDGKTYSGESYVVFGKRDGEAVDLSAVFAGTGGFVIKGATVFGQSGLSVSGAGDVNGDGLADVIVGAPVASESYVVFGKRDGEAVELSEVSVGLGGALSSRARTRGQAGASLAQAMSTATVLRT